jgi:hypothetical protein
VGHVLGAEDERAGPRLYRLLAYLEGHLAFEDVEGLVLLAVQVQRRSGFLWFENLDDRVEVGVRVATAQDLTLSRASHGGGSSDLTSGNSC